MDNIKNDISLSFSRIKCDTRSSYFNVGTHKYFRNLLPVGSSHKTNLVTHSGTTEGSNGELPIHIPVDRNN